MAPQSIKENACKCHGRRFDSCQVSSFAIKGLETLVNTIASRI